MKIILVNDSEQGSKKILDGKKVGLFSPYSDVNNRVLGLKLNKAIRFLIAEEARNWRLLRRPELVIAVLDPAKMKSANFKFRKKNKPTDILSFQSEDPECLGELLICAKVISVQAKEQKHEFESELLYMLIHGLLHLIGYDHEKSKKEEKVMFDLQDRCFQFCLKRQRRNS